MREVRLDYCRCDCSADRDGIEDHSCSRGGAKKGEQISKPMRGHLGGREQLSEQYNASICELHIWGSTRLVWKIWDTSLDDRTTSLKLVMSKILSPTFSVFITSLNAWH